MLIDIVDRIRSVLTDPDVRVDTTGKMPATFEPRTLYVFPDPESDATIDGAESGPPSRQNFSILSVYMASDRGEESRQERTQAVSDVLSSRRDDYIERLQARESCDLWDHVEVTSDADWTSNFEGRAIAVRASGYRLN